MTRPEKLSDLVHLGLGDATVRAISWENEGEDVLITLDVPAFPGELVHILFR